MRVFGRQLMLRLLESLRGTRRGVRALGPAVSSVARATAGHGPATILAADGGIQTCQAGVMLYFSWATLALPDCAPAIVPCELYNGRWGLRLAGIVPLVGLTVAQATQLLYVVSIYAHNAGRVDLDA